ncbi:MAG: hypothetical protein Q9183_004258 [Haloplaca sp. 2 TL-2023]
MTTITTLLRQKAYEEGSSDFNGKELLKVTAEYQGIELQSKKRYTNPDQDSRSPEEPQNPSLIITDAMARLPLFAQSRNGPTQGVPSREHPRLDMKLSEREGHRYKRQQWHQSAVLARSLLQAWRYYSPTPPSALVLTFHLQTVIWLVVAMAILFAIVRFLIRVFALKKLLPDDFAVAAALVVLLSLAIMYEYATPIMFELDRITRGLDPFTPEFLPRAAIFLKLQFAIIVLFWTSIWVVKVSFLLFYRTLFTGLREHMVNWWLVAGMTAITYLLCWAFQLGSCVPISDYFILGE